MNLRAKLLFSYLVFVTALVVLGAVKLYEEITRRQK